MQNISYGVLAFILLTGAMIAIFSKNLIRSALALGLSSVALAMIFFMLGAPYAGGFELSVGAGLISVLFLMTISLTQTLGKRDNEP